MKTNRWRTGRSLALTLRLTISFAVLAAAPCAWADETNVAVATNFAAAAKEIGAQFTKATGHRAIFSFGATGQLYAQITQGAPFDIYLAADRERPARIVDAGLAISGSQFTYATGRLVLFSKDPSYIRGKSTLIRDEASRIAIANPAIAPYGAAAIAAMKSLGLYESAKSRLVRGANIAQTYQFVYTGNAEIGFVSYAQLAGHTEGSRWIVPTNLHPAIAQNAVLLKRGKRNQAALAFLIFLKGSEARSVKEKYGYDAGS